MKSKLFSMALLLAFAFGLNGTVHSQEKAFPAKGVQLVVGMRAGGGFDLFFRLLAEELKKNWKVPVNVENQDGAMGVVAANAVATGRKDGYTVLATVVGTLSSISAANPKGAVNLLRDFDPIFVNPDYASMLFFVRSESTFKTLKDLVDHARAKPGDLICGTTPRGTEIHLQWELFKRVAKLDVTTLAYSGSSEVIPQLLGGHIQIAGTSDAAAKPYIDAGKVRGLVTDTRSIVIPEMPTFIESGYPDVNLFGSFALLAPHGTPPAVIKAWHDTLEGIFKDAAFIVSTRKLGFKSNYQLDSPKITDFFKKEVSKYSRFTPEELGWK
jgi:tripartite-type tricarboxylate transporter receptor subunit TctC